MNELFSSSVSTSNVNLCDTLHVAKWKNLKEPETGYIFTDEHLATTWENIDVYPDSLTIGEAGKGMRKITSPTLLLKSHSSKMAFILATEDLPVIIPSKWNKTDGYTMLFSLMPNIFPEYFFYLSKYNSWTRISNSLEYTDYDFEHVGTYVEDGRDGYFIQAEDLFLSGSKGEFLFGSPYAIPSLPVQRQQIEDAKTMEKVVFGKISQEKRKFQQKEWLNETHIRNSKHRLSNEIMPTRMAVERLEKFIANSEGNITLSTIIGKVTQQTIGDLFENLKISIQNIENEINNLTKSETAGEQPEVLDVESFIKDYFANPSTNYNVEIEVLDKDLMIKIARKSFLELFNNIISNAERHGFTDRNRDDYKIHITLSKTEEGFCKIDIANNGDPISERGRKEYFVRGSFAGETGHTGIGGARVFEICEEAKGKTFEPYSTDEFPVVVSVEFPIVSF